MNKLEASSNTVTRAIPHQYIGLVKGVKDKTKKKMLLNSYIRGFFKRSEPGLELVDINIKRMTAILSRK